MSIAREEYSFSIHSIIGIAALRLHFVRNDRIDGKQMNIYTCAYAWARVFYYDCSIRAELLWKFPKKVLQSGLWIYSQKNPLKNEKKLKNFFKNA